MKKNYNLMTLVTELENIVGNCYHNQQKRGGFYFRYPVNYEGGYQTKKRLPDIKPDNLNNIRGSVFDIVGYLGREIIE